MVYVSKWESCTSAKGHRILETMLNEWLGKLTIHWSCITLHHDSLANAQLCQLAKTLILALPLTVDTFWHTVMHQLPYIALSNNDSSQTVVFACVQHYKAFVHPTNTCSVINAFMHWSIFLQVTIFCHVCFIVFLLLHSDVFPLPCSNITLFPM